MSTNTLTNYFKPILYEFHDREAIIYRTGFRAIRISYLDLYDYAYRMANLYQHNGLEKGDWLQSLLFAVSVAVGLTPEMLPMIVTTNLAKGAVTMARRKTIVKRLNAIQNFGAMDVLCTDKTGTLTQNKIILERHLDIHGHDEYYSGNWTLGIGYWFGTGIALDKNGNDHYKSCYFTQASGAHYCNGIMIDEGGDDHHELYETAGAALAFGWDFTNAVLINKGGNDRYTAKMISYGLAEIRSNAFFIDIGGDEYYPCLGDITGDGVVGLNDLAQLMGHYGATSGAAYEEGDLDFDGDIDLYDLAELLGYYGTVCSPP